MIRILRSMPTNITKAQKIRSSFEFRYSTDQTEEQNLLQSNLSTHNTQTRYVSNIPGYRKPSRWKQRESQKYLLHHFIWLHHKSCNICLQEFQLTCLLDTCNYINFWFNFLVIGEKLKNFQINFTLYKVEINLHIPWYSTK